MIELVFSVVGGFLINLLLFFVFFFFNLCLTMIKDLRDNYERDSMTWQSKYETTRLDNA